MADSTNEGFTVLDAKAKKYKVRLFGSESIITSGNPGGVFPAFVNLMDTIVDKYGYML